VNSLETGWPSRRLRTGLCSRRDPRVAYDEAGWCRLRLPRKRRGGRAASQILIRRAWVSAERLGGVRSAPPSQRTPPAGGFACQATHGSSIGEAGFVQLRCETLRSLRANESDENGHGTRHRNRHSHRKRARCSSIDGCGCRRRRPSKSASARLSRASRAFSFFIRDRYLGDQPSAPKSRRIISPIIHSRTGEPHLCRSVRRWSPDGT
jgi:hypothetical protein